MNFLHTGIRFRALIDRTKTTIEECDATLRTEVHSEIVFGLQGQFLDYWKMMFRYVYGDEAVPVYGKQWKKVTFIKPADSVVYEREIIDERTRKELGFVTICT